MTGSKPSLLATCAASFAAAAIACGGDKLILPEQGLPAAIVIIKGNGQADTVGHTLPDTLIVRITDSKARPVAQQDVRFVQPTNSTGAQLIPETTQTDADGQARARWVLGTVTGQQTVRAIVDAPGNPLSADFIATAAPEAPDTMFAVSGDDQSGEVGSDLGQPLVATLTDRFGNPVGGVTVSWTAEGGGSVSPSVAVTGADGRVSVNRTLGPTAGVQNAVATVPGLKGSPLNFTQISNPGDPTLLLVESGNGQSGPTGEALTQPLVVRLMDAMGNGLADRPVLWPVNAGGGSIVPTSANTDANGRASAVWTLGPNPGLNRVISSVTGLSVTFDATGLPSPPSRIAANSPTELDGIAGNPVSPIPSVRVTDAHGLPVEGVLATFTVTHGGGVVAAASAATNASGIATIAFWSLGAVAGDNTLKVSAQGSAGPLGGSPVVFKAVGVAGAMSRLAVITQPSESGVSGVPLARSPAIQLQDASGNDVSGSGVVVTATLAGSPAGANLSSATATTDAAGRAVLNGLTISGPPASYRLLFTSSPVLLPATSAEVVLSAPAAAKLSLAVQPSPAVSSGQVFPVQPVVQIVDPGGVPVAVSGVICQASLASGAASLGGTLTATTNSAGIAVFTSLSISGPPGLRTLQFSAPGLTSVISQPVNVSAQDELTLTITTQPSASVANGAVFPTQPVALVRDGNGNTVGGVVVTAEIGSGGGTLAGPLSATSDGGGRAAFNNLSLIGTVGSHSLSLRAGAALVSTSVIVLTPGPATPDHTTATITTSKGPPKDRETTIVVQTRDQTGNDLKSGGNSIEIIVSPKDHHGPGPGGGPGDEQPLTVTDNGDGTYTASYKPEERKGTDLIAITLDGVAISGSPYTNNVH